MVIYGEGKPWPREPGQIECYSKDLATSHENEQFSAHHLRIEPGGEFLSHAHDRQAELHYVIAGRCLALDGEEWHEVGAGDVVLCPPGLLHAFKNVTAAPAEVLCVFTPPLY